MLESVLIFFGVLALSFIIIILIVSLFIAPRLIGTIHVLKNVDSQSLYIELNGEEDFKKLEKYTYVVLRSSEYKSQK